MQRASKTAFSVSPVVAFGEVGSLKFGLVLLRRTDSVVGTTIVGTNLLPYAGQTCFLVLVGAFLPWLHFPQ